MKLSKKQLEDIIRETASEYVYGVKNPSRVANKYKLTTLKKILLEEIEDLGERCQKGYKTHPTQKTKEMYGKTYRNCIKAEGMGEDAMDEIFGLTNSISSNILHLGKEDRALIERDLDKIRDLAQTEVVVHEKIEKVDSGYYVTSKSGRRLSKKPHKTKKAALAQLGAVEASKAGRSK